MSLFGYIKHNLSILEVIGSYATLKKAGMYYKGVCPFHYEKTPSFTVSPHKEIFYCFGCHSGGDVIAFIAKAEHCSQLEAAKLLAERYQIEVPAELALTLRDVATSHNEKKRYFELCALVREWLSQQLHNNKQASDYLLARGLSSKVIEQYNIGYFPGGPKQIQGLIDKITKEKFLVDDLIKAHIVSHSKSVIYSAFEERIIFPINDHLGNTCGFGGRIFKTQDERPKYYNSKEHAYFSKGSLFFGLDNAKSAIQKENLAFLVEGYTDCLAMATHGYPNTVATLGTACSLEHLKILSRFTEKLYIMYDGDQAGQSAMLRLTELCWQVNIDLYIIELPQSYDPAAFLQEKNNLAPYIEQAKDIFDFFLNAFTHQYAEKTLNQRLQQVRTFLVTISTIEDTLKKELLLSKAAERFEMPLDTLKRELVKIKRGTVNEYASPIQQINTEEPSPDKILKEIPLLEKKLFFVILNHTYLVGREDDEYLNSYISTPLQSLYKKLMKLYAQDSTTSFTSYFETLTEQEKTLVSRLVLECHEYEEPENYHYLLEQFQKKMWKSFVADTKISINRARQLHDEELLKKVLTQFQELKEKLVRKGLI